MSTFLTAKDILLANDLLAKREKEEIKRQKERHAAHEFQAYAYRLASDLNDLQNLKIYMRLSKSIERSLLERVYAFVSDITEENKGPLFLWKLKQVRAELKTKRELTNFEYSFVMRRMRDFRNSLSETIFQKYDDYSKNPLLSLGYDLIENTKGGNCLILGNTSSLLPSIFASKGYKVHGIDFSTKLTNQLKAVYPNMRKCFITKDFLKNNYSNNQFELVVLNKFWQFIPLEEETKFINEFKRILCDKGKLIFEFKANVSDNQQWHSFGKMEKSYYFEKQNSSKNLIEKLKIAGFSIKKLKSASDFTYLEISKTVERT